MEKRIIWHLETWTVDKLIPHLKNPRVITEDKLLEIERSFDDIGFAQPLNINLDGTILSGHARYYQLKKEGIESVDCYVPDRMLTPKQEEAVIIRMNKNIAGSWDFDKLANEFELSDLIDWGFSASDFQIPELDPDDDPKDDEENKKYILQVELPNELDLRDLYDDLISKGYLVKEL